MLALRYYLLCKTELNNIEDQNTLIAAVEKPINYIGASCLMTTPEPVDLIT